MSCSVVRAPFDSRTFRVPTSLRASLKLECRYSSCDSDGDGDTTSSELNPFVNPFASCILKSLAWSFPSIFMTMMMQLRDEVSQILNLEEISPKKRTSILWIWRPSSQALKSFGKLTHSSTSNPVSNPLPCKALSLSLSSSNLVTSSSNFDDEFFISALKFDTLSSTSFPAYIKIIFWRSFWPL